MGNRESAEAFINFFVKVKNYVRFQIHCGKCASITEQQFRTLIYLRKLGKTNLKDLSENVYVSPSSLCIMLNRMVEEGYVEREVNSKDRRNTFYCLSKLGEEFLSQEFNKKVNVMEEKLSRLSEEKKERFMYCINELEKIIDELD